MMFISIHIQPATLRPKQMFGTYYPTLPSFCPIFFANPTGYRFVHTQRQLQNTETD